MRFIMDDYWQAQEYLLPDAYLELLYLKGRTEAQAHDARIIRAERHHSVEYPAFLRTLRDELAHNLRPTHHTHWRFGYLGGNFKRARDRYRDFGRDLAEAIANGDGGAVLDLVRDDNELARAAFNSDNAPDMLTDDYFVCERCNNLEPQDDGREVHVGRRNTEIWCDLCCQKYAVECDGCGEIFPNDDMYHTDGGRHICPSCYGENYFTCDRCGGTYSNDDYASDGLCNSCYNEAEEESSDGLDGYHDASRRWQILHSSPDTPYHNAPAVGVELEVYSESRADAVGALRDLAGSREYPSPLILEEDSSLSERYGFEVVTHPMGLCEHQQYSPALLQTLIDNDGKGWDASDGYYGIHITVARNRLSPLQEARMLMFLTAQDNYDFVVAVAQRERVYSATLNMGGLIPANQKIRAISTAPRLGKKIGGIGKYSPINLKSELAEFRIFQSTLNLQSYLKNIEFVYALLEWTRPESATGSKWFYKDFLAWFKTRPLARKHYPNLVGYLERPTLPVKGRGKITNLWKEYLPRQTLDYTQPEATEREVA